MTRCLSTFATLFLLSAAVSFVAPPEAHAQQRAQELMRQRTGQEVTQQEILRRLAASGLTRQHARARLRAQGMDPSMVDPYYDELEGREGVELPEADESFLEVLTRIGIAARADPALPDTLLPAADTLDTDEPDGPRVFGRDVFSRATTQFEAVMAGPVDTGYRLGPGDELHLILTGDVELAYILDVTREGFVVIPDVGQLSVHGLTLEQLRDRLYTRLGNVYSGVRRDPGATTHFDVSLGRLRTNLVYVIGEVASPSAYQVSSVSTAFNALHRAGGPTRDGSFRTIRVRRAGQVAAEIDLYDYLLYGDASQDIRLEQGDIVFVPMAGPQVTAQGQVRREAIYELKPGERLERFLTYAGGLRADAHVRRIQIDRILPFSEREPWRDRVLVDVDLQAFWAGETDVALADGDVVEVFGVLDERRNRLRLEGAVYRPGLYEYRPGSAVGDLIERAGGVLPAAFQPVAHVLRPNLEDGSVLLHRVALDGDGPAGTGFPLEDLDQVVVFSVDSLQVRDSVSVAGLVKEPEGYPLARGMNVEDLILAAGGFERGADPFQVEVTRRQTTLNRQDTITVSHRVALSARIPYPDEEILSTGGSGPPGAGAVSAEAFELRHGDRIYVRRLAGWEDPIRVTIDGEVHYPGEYAAETRRETVSSVLARSGGPTETAYLDGFRLIREGLPVSVNLEAALADPGGPRDMEVRNGDRLILPAYDPTVRVVGAVAFEARVRYREEFGLQDYLAQAGGPLSTADASRISVEYQSGERALVRRRLRLFTSRPDVRPGSTIYVPERPTDQPGFDWDRFLTRTLAVASTAATVLIAIDRF